MMATGGGYPQTTTTADIGMGTLTVQNTGTSDLIIAPGNTWTPGDMTNAVEARPQPQKTKLALNAMKRLVDMSAKVEELFEFKYRINPEFNMYSGVTLSFNVSLHDNRLVVDSTTPVSSFTEPLIENVQGEDDKLRSAEVLHATAKMVYAVLTFRKNGAPGITAKVRAEPTDAARNFIYDVAKGFAFKDHEVPKEALGKLALLSI